MGDNQLSSCHRFQGRVVAITGGAAGIGLAAARRIAAEGGRVAILDWSNQDLSHAVGLLEQEGAGVVGVQGDTASKQDCAALVSAAIERWGRLDGLVANAGIRASGSLLEAPDEDWDRILAVNLRGVACACVEAARVMRAAGNGGSLVLVSSQNAIVGRASMPIYDAAKAGVLSLARSLAVDLADDRIRVNSVCPGFTVTDYHVRRAEAEGRTADDLRAAQPGLFKRPAEPEEIAAAIVFLASDDASYITATTLFVDGGRHAT
ncbi:MAG TPA: SDR family oxidoreductase [Armatimonadota bacterium]|nr:SDR family oxidoreductase [Armatimonadota bacterium]